MGSINKTNAKAAIVSYFVVFIFFLNPFGMRTATERHSENLVINFYAYFHPEKPRNEIAIVLIDDVFIQNHGGRFPVSYFNLKNLLKVISYHNPTAVFFDITQYYEHSNNLSSWLKQLNKANQMFPVFLASIPSIESSLENTNPNSLRSKLAKVSSFTAVGWDNQAHYYPLDVTSNNVVQDTAAMSLYRVWCAENSNECKPISDQRFRDPMIVQWGVSAAKHQQRHFHNNIKCQHYGGSSLMPLWKSVLSHFNSSLFPTKEKNELNPCPYLLTITASELLDNKAINSKNLRESLQDRIILVGYNLAAGTDVVLSPVNGTLPGVYYHAAALENLIAFSDDYWHVPENISYLDLNTSDLLEGILQLVLFYWIFSFRFKYIESQQSQRNPRIPIVNLRLALFSVTITLAIVLLAKGYFKLGAVNWYAFFMVLITSVPTILHVLITRTVTYIKARWQHVVSFFKKKIRSILISIIFITKFKVHYILYVASLCLCLCLLLSIIVSLEFLIKNLWGQFLLGLPFTLFILLGLHAMFSLIIKRYFLKNK